MCVSQSEKGERHGGRGLERSSKLGREKESALTEREREREQRGV